MSKPILDFSLDKLNFQNRFLNGSSSQASPLVPPIYNDNEKPVHLASGKTITLKKKKKKPKTINSTISFDNMTQEEKANYGFNVNELFARLEVQKLKQSQSTTNGIKPQKKKHKSYFKNAPKETLWAEKWRPNTFFDFVGNEATNRRILKWLRQWDRVVFEKNFKPITTEDTQANRFSDPFGRPERKVLLISGPPGLGKTTVAHVIAKQAGYEVMEINASDERAGQRVKEKVNNSLTSLTFSGKPVCLVADEVDGGAEFGFIKVLTDLLNEDTKTIMKFQSSESSKFFSQKGKNKPKFLLRPIICICNDVYVSALEKLRPLAEMISFQQASEAALSDRLRFICEGEGIHMTNAQLKEIIHLTDFDIRSCVNLLQFGGGLNTSDDSRKKDFQMTWYGVVNEIFKRSPKVTKSEQFNRVAKLVSANTNLDKVINGCFQAYPDIHFQDTAMSKPAMISDWLFFADRMSHAQFEAIGDLSYYQSQVALQFFNQFSDMSNRSNIKIKSDWEYFEKKKKCQNIIKIMYSRLSPQLRSLLSEPDLAVQVLPYLEIIIAPERRSSYQLREKEQQRIVTAVEAIQGFGLYLNRAKDSDYNEIFVTYPDFTPVTRFDPTAVRKQQQRQTQVFPTLLREIETIRAKKRTFKEMEGVPMTTQSNINELKDQYNKINEMEESSKKQKVSVKIWVKYHEGFSNAVRKPIKWRNLWG